MSRKDVTLTLRVTFEGDYYGPDEVVDVAMDWIQAGLEDRDDCRGAVLRSSKVEVS